MTNDSTYFARDAEFADEDHRLRLIEQGCDPHTVRCLMRLGVDMGWRCLEVAAGAGSIAAWLGERVGPSGYVLATDIDTRHLEWISAPNIVIRTHDILAGGLDDDGFDLAHCRGLLEHLADPDLAIHHMVTALKPGGLLVLEGADFGRYQSVDHQHPLADVFDTAMRKLFSFIRTTGTFDPFIGPSLPGRLQNVGLEEIVLDDTGMIVHGGGPMAIMFDISWQRFDPVLKAHDVLNDSEIAGRHAALRDESFAFSYGGIAASARRPM